ncbi:hypothetical protein [Chitinimonas taiwanensis]|uniref:hypothetical protein n=1 Tax=Chitinimonas taiwanensis TaxID=240412 RepID=UPI0015872AA1|nr:hypothetical protein [Chitinimonas taiwanensis]
MIDVPEHQIIPAVLSHTLAITDRLGLDAACIDNPESPIRFHRADATEVGCK